MATTGCRRRRASGNSGRTCSAAPRRSSVKVMPCTSVLSSSRSKREPAAVNTHATCSAKPASVKWVGLTLRSSLDLAEPREAHDVGEPAGRFEYAPAVAADEQRHRLLQRRREAAMTVHLVVLAVRSVTSSPASSWRMIEADSAILATRTAGGSNRIPASSYSCFMWPAPRPSSSRPPVRRSTVAASRARTTGCRKSLLITSVPSRSRSVTSAAVDERQQRREHALREMIRDEQRVEPRGFGAASLVPPLLTGRGAPHRDRRTGTPESSRPASHVRRLEDAEQPNPQECGREPTALGDVFERGMGRSS